MPGAIGDLPCYCLAQSALPEQRPNISVTDDQSLIGYRLLAIGYRPLPP
jgi:hypothetical protein